MTLPRCPAGYPTALRLDISLFYPYKSLTPYLILPNYLTNPLFQHPCP
jgi:hypothetical protein